MNSYGANNNSLTNPNFVLKLSMVTFLIVQAIRQLVLVNAQATAKTESRAGQVAAWMTITLTLVVAALLYPTGPLSRKNTLGGLFVLFAGVMGSGIAMIYDGMKNKGSQEKNRLWFGIAHVVFAMLVFAFLLYSMTA
jgi:cytochrome bd-type quinol oxidase subunit 2